MVALVSLLIIIVLSITVVRIGAAALELTGLSRDVAEFQAQSAFSGAGFTTQESETIVTHPLRRRFVRVLILLGSVGISSSIATFILTFIGIGQAGDPVRAVVLVGGFLVIFAASRSKQVYRLMRSVIQKSLRRWTTIDVYDYDRLLGFNEGYTISRYMVKADSWMRDHSLRELDLGSEGALILAIYRPTDGEMEFLGAPRGDTVLREGDLIICYSREDVSKNLATRMKGVQGNREHEEKVAEEQGRGEDRRRFRRCE